MFAPSYFPRRFFPEGFFPSGMPGPPVWPTDLPSVPRQEGYSEQRRPLVVRTDMDVGPPKVRMRQTTSPTDFSMSFLLTGSQVEVLMYFWEVICLGGSVHFDWVHPRTRVAAKFRFVSAPMISPSDSATAYRVAVSLEMLP